MILCNAWVGALGYVVAGICLAWLRLLPPAGFSPIYSVRYSVRYSVLCGYGHDLTSTSIGKVLISTHKAPNRSMKYGVDSTG